MTQFCTFYLDEKTYGMEILAIQEIVYLHDITPVPHSPAFVAGLANLRGQIIVVVNLRILFGLPPITSAQEPINIILRSEEESIGLLADRAGEVIEFGDEAMILQPSPQESRTLDLIKGVFALKDTLLNIIDPEAIFKDRNVMDANALKSGFAGEVYVEKSR